MLLDLDQSDSSTIVLPESCTLLYTVPPNPDSPGDTRLAAFLARIRPAPQRIVYLSTSGVYGDRAGEITRESDTPNPTSKRAHRRLDAEQQLTQWCRDAGSALLIFRVPGIYGPGRLGLERLRDAEAIIREADSGPGNRIHVDDLAACCIAALARNVEPGIYNIADGDYRSNYWFRRTVAAYADLPAPTEISLQEALRTWSATRVSFLTESRKLALEKMRANLDVELRYGNAEDGIRASLPEPSV